MTFLYHLKHKMFTYINIFKFKNLCVELLRGIIHECFYITWGSLYENYYTQYFYEQNNITFTSLRL